MNNHYNKNLKDFANQNRKVMTKAEASLWKYLLKSSKLNGFSFNRQRPISNYIVDFYSKELKLVIEVDGNSHNIEEINLKDKVRQKELEDLGLTVIRFTDNEVLNNLDGVRMKLIEVIYDLRS